MPSSNNESKKQTIQKKYPINTARSSRQQVLDYLLLVCTDFLTALMIRKCAEDYNLLQLYKVFLVPGTTVE